MKHSLLIALVLMLLPFSALAADTDFDGYTDTESLQTSDEFMLYRPGTGLMNYTSTYFYIDASGNIQGPTTLTLPNTGLHLYDTNGDADLVFAPGSNLTADRTLTITTGDADRTFNLGGDFTTGTHSVVFTTSGSTSLTLPTSGTLLSSASPVTLAQGGTGQALVDPDEDAILFWDDSAGAVDFLTIGSGLTITGTELTSSGGGSGDVTAASTLTDNAIIRGDGGSKGVQESLVTISDTGAIINTSSAATCLALGPNGATSPVFQVDCDAASQDTGIKVLSVSAASDYAGIQCQATDGTCNLMLRGTGSTRGLNIDPDGDGSTDYTIRKQNWILSPGTLSTASTVRWLYTAAADTSLSGGTEAPVVKWDLSATRQHNSNTAITDQRDFQILGTTHSFVTSGGVITNGASLYITPPSAGTNATITNARAIWSTGSIYSELQDKFDATVTSGGTTGNQTINKPTGTVNFAASATSLTVTNSLVSANSLVFAVIRTDDATATIKNVVPGSGSFVINLTAEATAETSVGFMVVN